MSVLVTGGGGFLGGAIVRLLLRRGETVRILGRSPQPELAALGVECFSGDIADPQAVAKAVDGVDAVFHVAAKAGVWGDRKEFFAVNLTGTLNVIDACRKFGVGDLIHTSTPSVVFSGEPFRGADESLPYGRNWLCAYAESKAEAEKAVLAAHDGTSLRTIALRPHLIWGPGDPHLVPRVLDRAASGRLRIVGDGHNKVDLTYIDNAASAHLAAWDGLRSGATGGKAYFITNDEPVVLWDWVNQLLGMLGRPPVQKKISLAAAYRIGATLEFVYRSLRLQTEPRMTRFVAVELAKDHYFNCSAAQRDFGYTPAVSVEQGLGRLVENLGR